MCAVVFVGGGGSVEIVGRRLKSDRETGRDEGREGE